MEFIDQNHEIIIETKVQNITKIQDAINQCANMQRNWEISITLIDDNSNFEYQAITRDKLNNKDWSKLAFETIIAYCPSVYYARPGQLFWIRKEVPSKRYQLGQVSQDIYDASTIVEVLTTDELIAKYQ
jgi:hypothetical protein